MAHKPLFTHSPILDKEKPMGEKDKHMYRFISPYRKEYRYTRKYEIILDTEGPTKCFEIRILPEFEGTEKQGKNKLPLL